MPYVGKQTKTLLVYLFLPTTVLVGSCAHLTSCRRDDQLETVFGFNEGNTAVDATLKALREWGPPRPLQACPALILANMNYLQQGGKGNHLSPGPHPNEWGSERFHLLAQTAARLVLAKNKTQTPYIIVCRFSQKIESLRGGRAVSYQSSTQCPVSDSRARGHSLCTDTARLHEAQDS
jgi:hypothetical protein